MDYVVTTLINEELAIIQDRAMELEHGVSPLRNDIEIRHLIDEFGYRYVEDFIDDDILEELNELNNFDDENEEIIEEQEEIDKTIYTSTSTSYKDMVQESVTNEFTSYVYQVKIVGVNIKPKHWDLLFDTVYEVYQSNNAEKEFLDDMSRLNRFAFSLALIRNSLVDINCYIEGLGYMESSYLSESDISVMQEKLSSATKEKKILDISDNIKENKKKVKSSRNLYTNKIIDFNSHRNN